jgi:tetratricopeptide (TPR) repeat protein
MANRTPSQDDLRQLSRDEWENLCALICTSFFSAHRVEDHFGKGNGLDAFREIAGGVEGWQFRRFNDRLGSKQANHIKENIILAQKKCLSELKKPLSKFTVIFNIDPEPGHKNVRGEIERLNSLKEWAETEHNIEFYFKGITWVLHMLLKNPTLKPELFEDVNSAINELSKSLRSEFFDLKNELKNLRRQNPLEGKLKETFDLLVREANIHYERGIDLESKEEFRKSIVSLEDAARLLKDRDINTEFEGKIFAFLSGVEVITGFLNDAINHATKAIDLLCDKENAVDHYIFAQGNLAFALYRNQEYEKSKKYFLSILKHFESEGNLLEIVRTLSHLLELETQSGSIDSAIDLIDRVGMASGELDKLLGPTDITASSLGSVANLYAEIGVKTRNRDFLNKAVALYVKIESTAKNQNLNRMLLTSKAARARCLWNLDKLEDAEKLHNEIIIEGKEFLPKIAIDAKFNLALLLLELNKVNKTKQLLAETIKEYEEIGDFPSIQDAKNMLEKIEKH